jgi:hypothetical protein
MMKKLMFAPFIFATAIYADSSNDTDIQIPEGKIIDYPSIYHDVTPSAGPRVIDGCGVFVTGDYLYWTARQDNMQYAATGFTNDTTESTRPGTVAQLKFKFRTGFKAGIGFSFGHDLWDMALNYTWFQSNHNKGSVSGEESLGLTPTFTPFVTLGTAAYFLEASSVWRLHFNALDLDLGRNFYISKFLSLRPFIGLKGSLQNQHNTSAYSGVNGSGTFDYVRKLSSSFVGMGIRTGCNMGWHLAGTWSIYGDVALSSLWGDFETKRKDSVEQSDATVVPVSNVGHFHTATPVLELALGLRKDQWFCNNRFHFSAQAGWEEQIWFDQNQLPGNQGLALGGNLVLQGLTVRLRFDF